jgi:hypothetical protein
MGQMRNLCKILIEETERKRPLGRPRHRWEDTIRMHFREMEYEGVDWWSGFIWLRILTSGGLL